MIVNPKYQNLTVHNDQIDLNGFILKIIIIFYLNTPS